ncbi:MAG: F-box protein, partial [Candidatus Marithrix sp.]
MKQVMWNSLPIEVIEQFLKYLTEDELRVASKVCRQFNYASTNLLKYFNIMEVKNPSDVKVKNKIRKVSYTGTVNKFDQLYHFRNLNSIKIHDCGLIPKLVNLRKL